MAILPMSPEEIAEMMDAPMHSAILAAREWFLQQGFMIDGDNAVSESGYGSGCNPVAIIPLVKAIVTAERAAKASR